MMNVQDIYGRVLKNYISVTEEELGFTPPFQIEMGAIGLNGLRLSLPPSRRKWLHELSEPIVESQLQFRMVLDDTSISAQDALVQSFVKKLYDLANVIV
jgi:hypothetical protein